MYIHVYMCTFVSFTADLGRWEGGRLLTPTGFFKLVKFSYVYIVKIPKIGLVGLSPVPSSVQKLSGSKITT